MRISICQHWLLAAAFALNIQGMNGQTTPADPEVAALMSAYKNKIAQDVEAPWRSAQDDLGKSYVQALDRAQQDATLKGKLEEAATLRLEKETVSASPREDLPVLPPSSRELAALRKKYLDAYQALRASTQKKIEPLQKEMVRQLDALAVKLVREGKGDAALEARQLAKEQASSPYVFDGEWEDQTQKVTPKPKNLPIVLKKRDSINTVASFKPPVEIEVVARVEGQDLRLGYAADQLIFNWERRPDELRIDGGPADKSYIPAMGELPQKKFAVIRWYVGKEMQTITVDGKLRFSHKGDYSALDRSVSILAFGSEVTVQSIKTRRPGMPAL